MSDRRPIYTRNQFPCLDCPDRSVKIVDGKPVRCHSTCRKYLEAKAADEQAAEALRNKERSEMQYTSYYNRQLRRCRERRHK